ncbi:MAG: hypothetical protein R3B09_10635 [Nannocystaceae bacterium]
MSVVAVDDVELPSVSPELVDAVVPPVSPVVPAVEVPAVAVADVEVAPSLLRRRRRRRRRP